MSVAMACSATTLNESDSNEPEETDITLNSDARQSFTNPWNGTIRSYEFKYSRIDSELPFECQIYSNCVAQEILLCEPMDFLAEARIFNQQASTWVYRLKMRIVLHVVMMDLH